MLGLARREFASECYVKLGNLARLPFKDDSFDRVLSLETLEHSPSQEAFVAELIRVLKTGGRCVLSTPPRSAEAILRLAEAFFENHGEGPHCFPRPKRVLEIIESTGGEIEQAFPSLILPAGPRVLMRAMDAAVRRNPLKRLLFSFGLRHFYVFRKV